MFIACCKNCRFIDLVDSVNDKKCIKCGGDYLDLKVSSRQWDVMRDDDKDRLISQCIENRINDGYVATRDENPVDFSNDIIETTNVEIENHQIIEEAEQEKEYEYDDLVINNLNGPISLDQETIHALTKNRLRISLTAGKEKTSDENSISGILVFFAVLVFIGSVIIGFAIGDETEEIIGLAVAVACSLQGFLLLGFAKVIDLLFIIAHTRYSLNVEEIESKESTKESVPRVNKKVVQTPMSGEIITCQWCGKAYRKNSLGCIYCHRQQENY